MNNLCSPASERLQIRVLEARLDTAQRDAARLRRIVQDAAGHAVVVINVAGCITSWNESAEEITGCHSADALGSPAGKVLLKSDDVWPILPIELRHAGQGGAAPIERWHQRLGGGRVRLSGTVVLLRAPDGGPEGFLAVFCDRSSKQVELEQHKLLADEMRHRLKNSYALVQAVAVQSARHATTAEAFLPALPRGYPPSRGRMICSSAPGWPTCHWRVWSKLSWRLMPMAHLG